MIEWFKRQFRKFTAFIIALYLTIVTTKDIREREHESDICCDALEKWGVCQCESFRDYDA